MILVEQQSLKTWFSLQHRCLAICFIPATGKTISSFDIIYKSVMLGNNVRGFRGGTLFPRTPISTLCRAFIGRGLRPCYRGGPSGPYLSAEGGQLFTARFAGCGRGPSLRCVRLRRFCSLLLISFEMSSSLTSATRRLPRYCAGQKRSGPGKSCNVRGRREAELRRRGPGEFGRQRSGPGKSCNVVGLRGYKPIFFTSIQERSKTLPAEEELKIRK